MKRVSFKTALSFLILMIFISTSCRKNDSDGNPGSINTQNEEFTQDEVNEVDSTSEVNLSMNDVVLPNGEIASQFLPELDTAYFHYWSDRVVMQDVDKVGPLDAKNLLIKGFTATALNLTDRSKHQYPDEGQDKPAQNGIAYAYGAKDFTIRDKPSASKCSDQLHALDCSGMLSYIFQNAGVEEFPNGANNQRNSQSIQKALEDAFPQLTKIKVEDLGKIETSKFMSGDIIYWLDDKGVAHHIGMILKDPNGKLVVYFSNGRNLDNEDQCEKNFGKTRGPVSRELDDRYWFGAKSNYGIVRFNFEIEGKWDFHFKCADQSEDLFVLSLDFPPSSTKEFTITKDFVDYDGSHNQSVFNFKYDNTTSELSCEFTTTDGNIPGFERKDSFTILLEKDDSGYVPAEQVYIHGGTGCTAAVRLVNKG